MAREDFQAAEVKMLKKQKAEMEEKLRRQDSSPRKVEVEKSKSKSKSSGLAERKAAAKVRE